MDSTLLIAFSYSSLLSIFQTTLLNLVVESCRFGFSADSVYISDGVDFCLLSSSLAFSGFALLTGILIIVPPVGHLQ